MDQTNAINALAPFIALAKSATSPRAAADLISQATSAPNTYVFAELLQQPNIQALAGHKQHGGSLKLLEVFSWGTWQEYKASSGLPDLNPAQTQKLRLLSLFNIASQKPSTGTQPIDLSYASLQHALTLHTPLELEQLVIAAIYSGLLTATLNPASRTVVITSVAPLRDLAPGSVADAIAELTAWSGRCDSAVALIDAEIARVKDEAEKNHARKSEAKRQFDAFLETQTKTAPGGGSAGSGKGGSMLRSAGRANFEEREEEAMHVDGDSGGILGSGGGKKRGTSGGQTMSSFFSKTGGKDGKA